MTYKIKPEYLEKWGCETNDDTIITEQELHRLSDDWQIPIDELKEQLIEQEP